EWTRKPAPRLSTGNYKYRHGFYSCNDGYVFHTLSEDSDSVGRLKMTDEAGVDDARTEVMPAIEDFQSVPEQPGF
ncbi:MAG: hypothetical protein PVG89_15615, partial [Gammaproteobacteria bacterium]